MLQTELTSSAQTALHDLEHFTPSRFTMVGRQSRDRRRLEQRIRAGYGRHFGAHVTSFMPQLACYRDADGSTGIIGVRRAADESLFLESYLNRPIEAVIGDRAGTSVSRHSIAEVGQLVVDDRQIAAQVAASLFRDLVPFLAGEGFDWVCFTGTCKVRAILRRTGFCGATVGIADANRLPPGRDHWGDYYDNEPVVVIGKLDDPGGRWCRTAQPATERPA